MWKSRSKRSKAPLKKSLKCKYCGEEIEWARTGGKWIALKKNLMGIHWCPLSSLPGRHFIESNDLDEEGELMDDAGFGF
jgi:hypothetical protein